MSAPSTRTLLSSFAIWTCMLLLAASMFVPGCTSEGTSGVKPDSTANALGEKNGGVNGGAQRGDPYEQNEDLEIVTLEDVEDTAGDRYLEGRVRSKSGKPYSYIELNFMLTDASGRDVGVATATTVPRPDSTAATFRTRVTHNDAAHYRLIRSVAW